MWMKTLTCAISGYASDVVMTYWNLYIYGFLYGRYILFITLCHSESDSSAVVSPYTHHILVVLS